MLAPIAGCLLAVADLSTVFGPPPIPYIFTPNHHVAVHVISHELPGLNPFFIGLPAGKKANAPGSGNLGRWVELISDQGKICYAQWDLFDAPDAEQPGYVFGPDLPQGNGLTLSPAVAEYLGLDPQNPGLVKWRFVEDKNVQPGKWLQADERALLLQAMGKSIPDKPVEAKTSGVAVENMQALYVKAYLLINNADENARAHRVPAARREYDRALKYLRALAADPTSGGDIGQEILRIQAARDALQGP